VDLNKSFQSLSVTRIVENDLEEVKKRQRAELKKLEEEREQLRIREGLRQVELERIRARNQRVQDHLSKQNYCVRKKPFGNCDKSGCDNKLQSWKVTWRKLRSKQLSRIQTNEAKHRLLLMPDRGLVLALWSLW
jgi:hypothetical protein